MGNLRVQAIGLCRFSYLGTGGFKIAHDTLDDHRRYLYDPRRLDLRMIWFEQVFLPSWHLQTDPDYTMVVLLSEDFPTRYRTRIEDLTRNIPQFRLTWHPPGPHREVCNAAVKSVIDPAADVTAQFRLDDDDAVAVDYIAALRRDFALLQPFYREKGQMALDYMRGVLLVDRSGVVDVHPRLVQSWAAGMTLFLPRGDERSVLDFPHHKVELKMPVTLMSDQLMFARGSHAANDSVIQEGGTGFHFPPAKVDAALLSRFGIRLPALNNALSQYHSR